MDLSVYYKIVMNGSSISYRDDLCPIDYKNRPIHVGNMVGVYSLVVQVLWF